MSKKSGAIAAMVEEFRGREMDAHYLGYFACFNRGLYFEAHDVLEELWLPQRAGENGAFYKGLIQLAGAFVHLKKNRLRPAAALFNLAEANLKKFPGTHEHLEIETVLRLIQLWRERLETGQFEVNPLNAATAPELNLVP